MKKLILIIILFFVGCDINSEKDNGNLRVYNDTNLTIRIYYCYETENTDTFSNEDEVKVIYDVISLNAGETREIEIQSDVLFDGNIDVVYGGIQKHYDIDFDIFDQGVKHIAVSHFHDIAEQ